MLGMAVRPSGFRCPCLFRLTPPPFLLRYLDLDLENQIDRRTVRQVLFFLGPVHQLLSPSEHPLLDDPPAEVNRLVKRLTR